MLAGIAYLCGAYGVGATEPGEAGYDSILAQLTAAVVGRGWFYYVTIGSVLSVLALSANTGFADFPRLCRVIAQDGFLPHSFAHRGRRLVYSRGILVLAALSGGLLVGFGGITDNLIPLFAIGAFLAFTLSQAGMVAYWRKVGGPHARTSMAVNAAGAACTAVTLAVVLVSKFADGAWVISCSSRRSSPCSWACGATTRPSPARWPPPRRWTPRNWSPPWCCCRSGAGAPSRARRCGSP
jgi:amino acid transporter